MKLAIYDSEQGTITWLLDREGQIREGSASYSTQTERHAICMSALEGLMTAKWSTNKVGSVYELFFGGTRMIVHRHIDYPPDVWLLSCHGLGIGQHELGTGTFEEAREKALDIVEAKLVSTLEAFEKMRNG